MLERAISQLVELFPHGTTDGQLLWRLRSSGLRNDAPAFEALIEPDSIVPANREYVSPDLDDFVWGRGKTDAEFYVLKGEAEVRHWKVTQSDAPDRPVPVTLRLRQTPGQSWARLSVTSRRWAPLERSPIDLDWEALTPLAMTPEEVLEKLRTPPPTIPELVVERAHIALWRGADWAGVGAIPYLRARGRPATADEWVDLLRPTRRVPLSPERVLLVGTDGTLPPELSPEWGGHLDQALATFSHALVATSIQHPPADNDLVLALTWSFQRCPEVAQDRIVEAIEARFACRSHPLLSPRAAGTALIQGAGRAVTGAERLTRVLSVLFASDPNNNTINALAMILTRRDEAPAALTRELVDGFAAMLGHQLHDQVRRRSFAVKFRNTLSAIAGLFRWRVREPNALLANREPVAKSLRATLVTTEDMLETPAYRAVKQIDQKRKQIRKIIEFPDGKGDANILVLIEQDDDDDADEP